MGRFIDLTGRRFGFLTVLQRGPDQLNKSGRGRTMWRCRCDCGKTTLVSGSNLNSGQIKSCGCQRTQMISRAHKRCNVFLLNALYATGTTRKGDTFTIDASDYNLVRQYCWRRNREGYFIAQDENGRTIRLHRLVMGVEDDRLVDHINHDLSLNIKSNLRIVTKSENMQNSVRAVNNTSGRKGVSWANRERKWVASIKIHGKQLSLGYYDSFDDAVAARKAAEEKYFGEYSYDNSMAAVPHISI